MNKQKIFLPSTLLLLLLLLAACTISNPLADPTATPRPPVVAAPTPAAQVVSTPAETSVPLSSTGLAYNAEIIARSQVPVVAEVAGQILELNVDVGDSVMAGDIIAQIDPTLAEAQRAQAEAGLAAAQAQLDLATAAPDPADIAALEAVVDAARQGYNRARAGAGEEDKRLVLTQVRQAEAGVALAQSAYDRVSGNPFAAMLPEAIQLQQATFGLEAAQAQYDKVLKGASADVIAGAYAQLKGAESQLAKLMAGAKPAQIAAAEAQVKAAEMGLFMAQIQVDKATIKAPIAGVVAQLLSAEGVMAGPGVPILALLSHDVKLIVLVEESRLQELYIGQPATIQVDAYPNLSFAGEVAIISPALDPATRTIPITVRPTGDAAELKPGMFATVELMEKQ